MESRKSISKGMLSFYDSDHPTIESYWDSALSFTKHYYIDEYTRYNDIKPDHVTLNLFWEEYIWCVYVSGFSSKVMDSIFLSLKTAYTNPLVLINNTDNVWDRVSSINSNRRKFEAVLSTTSILFDLGWDTFKSTYLQSIDSMRNLSMIGPVTCHHLARNLGHDTVKPDLHLVRLADHYGFDDPLSMCEFLSGYSGERVGVVDLALFYFGSTYGTTHMKSEYIR